MPSCCWWCSGDGYGWVVGVVGYAVVRVAYMAGIIACIYGVTPDSIEFLPKKSSTDVCYKRCNIGSVENQTVKNKCYKNFWVVTRFVTFQIPCWRRLLIIINK